MGKKKKEIKAESKAEEVKAEPIVEEPKLSEGEAALKKASIVMSLEDRQELMIINLQTELLQTKMQSIHNESQTLEKQRLLCAKHMDEIKVSLKLYSDKRESFKTSLGQKLGVKISKCGIDPLTGVITKHY